MPRREDNPDNRFVEATLEWEGQPPPADLKVYEEEAKSALSENNSPDLNFRWGINPYRGCYHGCSYCYARPSHEYLGFGAGTDFERRIVVKTNLAERLLERFERRSWKGELIAFSGITDCYQPLEAKYRITRACLEVCAAYRNPVGIITKGAIIRRDVDVLQELSQKARLSVTISIPFLDDDMGRRFEPFASTISKRFQTLRDLSEAGIRTGVAVAPIIPGVNDADIPGILERARDAGASFAFMTLLRLPASVQPYFDVRLDEELPLRSNKVKNQLRSMRHGRVNDDFGKRMVGEGPQFAMIDAVFRRHCERLGYGSSALEATIAEEGSTFRRPRAQMDLFVD